MLQTILKSFQLTEKEVHVFLKVLSLGSQPASSIARVTELPRNTVRSILDNLVKRGLLVKSRRANTQYYAVESKESLVRSLRARQVRTQEELDRQIDLLERYGDELTNRHWATSRPKVTFYEGLAGLEKVYEDTLTAKNGIKAWASYDDLYAGMPSYFPEYFKRRANKKIPMRSIHPDSLTARTHQKEDKKEFRDSALVPEERFHWTPEIQVYNNKINIASWKDKLGIIIESEEIASALRTIFDLSFEAAERYHHVSRAIPYEELVASDEAPKPKKPIKKLS